MLTRPDTLRSDHVDETLNGRPRAPGLIVARLSSDGGGLDTVALVDELDAATIDRIRRTALTLRARHAAPITIEVRYVGTPETDALVGMLGDLRPRGIRVVRAGHGPGDTAERLERDEPSPTTAAAAHADGGRPAAADQPATVRVLPAPPTEDRSPDPFGLDLAYRRAWLPPLRFLFERYWRIEVSGADNVPARGAALIAPNHSGAVPADAFMVAVALELHRPDRTCLRVLYDKFVDALPWIGPLYNRLGGVPSSFANAELLLRRGEALAIFPEGIAGVEKRWLERYQLRAFKTGTARLSLATGSPIVPVAIVGAEEAYPVVARLYRAGRIVGVPWIPVTPLFPLCGVAGAIPLPSKWHIRFCPPIHPPAAAIDDEDAVAELTARVRRSIALALGDLLLTRRGVFA